MENTMKEMTIVPITGQVVSESTMGLDGPYINAEEVLESPRYVWNEFLQIIQKVR